ncbi:MAG: short-chain dehydrogenase [Gammaproteobacteria bacterium]|nr:short-chain dehydrogenase [Gammaproteobacteria bacterium]
MGRVEGKVCIVTGAASGLGEADVRLLAAEGASVIMTDINRDAGARIANDTGAEFIYQDVSVEEDWATLVKGVVEKYGHLDVLVNNAGIGVIADIETTTTEIWRKVLGVHLDSTFWGCQQAVKAMKETGGGSIINISSTTALTGAATYMAYSAAKGAIRSMSKSVALHCRANKYNIRCNSVHPGLIDTPIARDALSTLGGVDLSGDDADAIMGATGVGEPNDVANMVLFLASNESKHVNGTELIIDNCDTLV